MLPRVQGAPLASLACARQRSSVRTRRLLLGVLLVGAAWLAIGASRAAAQTGTGYSVTFVARDCTSYDDIFANKFRDNLMQTLQDVGPDSPYTDPTVLVNPDYEDLYPQSLCKPLTGWEFTMGQLPDLAPVTGVWGSLTAVNNAFPSVTTESSAPLLDQDGNQVDDETIDGAVNVELTQEQLEVADQGQWTLRLQGGTPTDPILANRFNFGDPTDPTYAFGALRCGNDNNYGDNVEGISFPEGVHHIFCYEFLVTPPPTAGLITIQKQVTGVPAGDNPSFPFNGTISYDVNGFQLTNGQSQDFFRAGSRTWTVTEGDVSNYRLKDVSCASANTTSTVTVNGSTATIDLADEDHVTCVYANVYVPPPGGLTIRKVTLGEVGTFSYRIARVANNGTIYRARATTTKPRVAVDAHPSPLSLAPGRYVILERAPVSSTGRWRLVRARCTGSSETRPPVTVTIESGKASVCTFVNAFIPHGSISVSKVTQGGTGTASFNIVPITGPPTPHIQDATTTTPGVAVDAKPRTPADATGQLPLGPYRITEQPPLSSTGNWGLTAVECNGVLMPSDQGTVEITLTRTSPDVHCVFTDTFTATPTPPVPPNPQPPPTPVPPAPPLPVPDYQAADLSVTKTASAPVVVRGDEISFRIVVENLGPDAAQQVVLGDQPRAAATVVAVHTPVGHCRAQTPIVCQLGTLTAGASVTITVRMRVSTHGSSFVNRAVVRTSTLEQNLADNVADARVKVASPPPPVVGCPSARDARAGPAHIAC